MQTKSRGLNHLVLMTAGLLFVVLMSGCIVERCDYQPSSATTDDTSERDDAGEDPRD